MAKNKKTKAWVKGLIAVAVIAVIGVLGYYGANGELFQGKSFKVDRTAKTVDKVSKAGKSQKVDYSMLEMDKVVVDGVDEKLIREVADRTTDERLISEDIQIANQLDLQADEQYAVTGGLEVTERDIDLSLNNVEERVAIDDDAVLDMGISSADLIPEGATTPYSAFSFETMLPSTADLQQGDVDVSLMDVRIENNYDNGLQVEQIRLLVDGGGVENFKVFVDGIEVSATVSTYEGAVAALNQTLTTVELNFDNPYTIPVDGLKTFSIRADVSLGSGESFVAPVLDAIATDQGIEFDTTYDFTSFTRDIIHN